MALDIHATRLLLLAKKRGANLSRTATLGHQWLRLTKKELVSMLRDASIPLAHNDVDRIFAGGPFADELLNSLGAAHLESIDASPYEGATLIHDMNTVIPRALSGLFTLVIDFGTLEHIFNFPIAIANCMRLLEVGGTLVISIPANNFMGHGFYQFSPELLYRVLSPENGFTVDNLFLCEDRFSGRWYEVSDPAHIGGRVELSNLLPTHMLLIAKKTADIGDRPVSAQQSDYAADAWNNERSPTRFRPTTYFTSVARQHIPGWLRDLRAQTLHLLRRPFRASYYRAIPTDKIFEVFGTPRR